MTWYISLCHVIVYVCNLADDWCYLAVVPRLEPIIVELFGVVLEILIPGRVVALRAFHKHIVRNAGGKAFGLCVPVVGGGVQHCGDIELAGLAADLGPRVVAGLRTWPG